MKAVVKDTGGKGAKLVDIPKPSIESHEVLIKVKAASICGTDVHIYEWNTWAQNAGINLPTVLGHECSGEVVEVGTAVTTLKVGDYVACETHIPCGICYQCKNGQQHICANLKIFGVHTDGCFAEYTKIPAICAVKIPESIPPEVAAIFEPLGTSVRSCEEVQVTGKNLLVVGCGPIGLMAINSAKAFGAAKIIATDVIDYRLNLAKEVGATVTINSKEENQIEKIMALTDGVGVDAFIDASGNTYAINDAFRSLRKGGMAALIGLPSKPIELDLVPQIVFKEATVIGIHGRKMFETWTIMSNLLDSKLLNVDPIITHTMKLEEFAEGFEILEKGLGGKIILLP